MFNIYGKIGPYLSGKEWINGVNSVLTNDFNVIGFNTYGLGNNWVSLVLNYTLNGMPTSFNESRSKSKFFSLLIYAGYPMQ